MVGLEQIMRCERATAIVLRVEHEKCLVGVVCDDSDELAVRVDVLGDGVALLVADAVECPDQDSPCLHDRCRLLARRLVGACEGLLDHQQCQKPLLPVDDVELAVVRVQNHSAEHVRRARVFCVRIADVFEQLQGSARAPRVGALVVGDPQILRKQLACRHC